MDTNKQVRVVVGSVIGARHQRAGRNGQDAVVAHRSGDVAVAVVCDGCSSGVSSEVGARVGATWFAGALAARLAAGASVADLAPYEATRHEIVHRLAAFGEVDGPLDPATIHDFLLFTLVAVAVTPAGAAVWALGDGAYGCDGNVRVLGPFADNAPPYLAYDLLGEPRDAHFEVLPAGARRIVIATDGAEAFGYDLAVFGDLSTTNPDALRRRLALLARGEERIAWSEGRVHRTPAVLQDDCAVAIVERVA
ncbi:MAG TPA: protein phosphatase 2C domain-containing protein [Kofleriaceae bacterium]